MDAIADGLADLMEFFLDEAPDNAVDLRRDLSDLKRAVGLGE